MNRLRELREDRDLTQRQVGEAIGVADNTIANYENEKRSLTADLINRFCNFYGVTADYLLCRSAQPSASVSDSDTAILRAYHAAPLEIRRIIDAALEPYKEEDQKTANVS